MTNWYKLDVAANLFPSVTASNNSSVFRLSAVMIESVDKDLLQKSVDKIFNRFPMFFVRMKKGVFWNYLDTQSMKFLVEEETEYPCATINPLETSGYLIKVLYYGNRISMEVFHSLTDGGGASEFLKSLLYYYLCYKYGEFDSENMILLHDGNIKENLVDSFDEYFSGVHIKTHEKKMKKVNSYRISGTPFNRYGHGVITGVLSAQSLNAVSKAKGATITSYLSAAMIYSIYQAEQRYSKDKNPIVIAIPVNLRKIFPSKTLRNFFSVVNLNYKVDKETNFDEIVNETTRQLKEFTKKDNLAKISAKNVSLTQNKFARFVPLLIKNIFMFFGFDLLGETKKTITISNMGNIKIPTGMEKYIKHFEAVIYPTAKSLINCGVISVNDRITINFSKTIKDTDIIRYFFEFLSRNANLEVGVYSNNWEEKV